MWNGKKKALTFSYDDGVTQDIRLVELFNKYGMKATFNLNSGKFGIEETVTVDGVAAPHIKINPEDVKFIYDCHEVAAHTVNHPRLTGVESGAEVIRQVEEDRIRLSELCGYEVVGFAYPCGGRNFDDRVSGLIAENTGIKYARTILSSKNFEIQDNLYQFKPTIHHYHFDELLELGEKFLSLNTDAPSLFYVWGHSYEFDCKGTWERFEEFLSMMSGKSDIFYGTNREVLL